MPQVAQGMNMPWEVLLLVILMWSPSVSRSDSQKGRRLRWERNEGGRGAMLPRIGLLC